MNWVGDRVVVLRTPCRVVVDRTYVVPEEEVTISSSEVVKTDSTLENVVVVLPELERSELAAARASLAWSCDATCSDCEEAVSCETATEGDDLVLVLVKKRDGEGVDVVLVAVGSC